MFLGLPFLLFPPTALWVWGVFGKVFGFLFGVVCVRLVHCVVLFVLDVFGLLWIYLFYFGFVHFILDLFVLFWICLVYFGFFCIGFVLDPLHTGFVLFVMKMFYLVVGCSHIHVVCVCVCMYIYISYNYSYGVYNHLSDEQIHSRNRV